MSEAPQATLNELELDALAELVNLGVSKAAFSLREMIGQQVFLSVPSVRLIARARAKTDTATIAGLTAERESLFARVASLEEESRSLAGITEEVEERLDGAIAEIRSALGR